MPSERKFDGSRREAFLLAADPPGVVGPKASQRSNVRSASVNAERSRAPEERRVAHTSRRFFVGVYATSETEVAAPDLSFR